MFIPYKIIGEKLLPGQAHGTTGLPHFQQIQVTALRTADALILRKLTDVTDFIPHQ